MEISSNDLTQQRFRREAHCFGVHCQTEPGALQK